MTTVVLNTTTKKVEVFSSARDVQARAEIAAHKAAADPHPQYLDQFDVADIAMSGDAGDLASGTVPDGRMPSWTGYNVASRAALEAANVPAAVDALTLLGYAAVGDGGGARYKRVAAEPAHAHKVQSADGAWWEELFAADVTVNIPSDFPTLQEAIDRLSKQPVRQGARIILNIESGHALTAGVDVTNGDYSRFKITSTDATVSLDASFPVGGSLLYGVNCRMPVLGILVDCASQDVGRFIRVEEGSGLHILDGCGAINGGGSSEAGLFVHQNSRVFGINTKFSGWAGHGAWITHRSDGYLQESDFSNCGADGVFVSRASHFYAVGSNFSGATQAGITVRRSYAVLVPTAASIPNFGGCGTFGIVAEMGATVVASSRGAVQPTNIGSNQGVKCHQFSNLYIQGMVIQSTTFDAIRCEESSRINAYLVEITTVGRDALVAREDSNIYAEDAAVASVTGRIIVGDKSSRVIAPGITATGAGGVAVDLNGAYADISSGDISSSTGAAVELINGAELRAVNTTATGAGGRGVNCDGSRAVLTGANFSGATTNGIRAVGGSDIIARNVNAQMGAGTSPSDVAIGHGSIVKFAGGTGGVSTTVNTISGSGIIFQ